MKIAFFFKAWLTRVCKTHVVLRRRQIYHLYVRLLVQTKGGGGGYYYYYFYS